jgi:hypothetical protein
MNRTECFLTLVSNKKSCQTQFAYFYFFLQFKFSKNSVRSIKLEASFPDYRKIEMFIF